MKNEEKIIAGCKKFKLSAQKELFEVLAPKMKFICMRYVRNIEEVDDILQEGFLKVFTKIKQYSGKGSFEGWAKRIIINTAIQHYRDNLKYYKKLDVERSDIQNAEEVRQSIDLDEIDNGEIDLDDVDENKINYDLIEKADFSRDEILEMLHVLPDDFMLVFNLYFIENYKHKEIGDMLGIDENTSRSRLSRARKIMQKELYKQSLNKIGK